MTERITIPSLSSFVVLAGETTLYLNIFARNVRANQIRNIPCGMYYNNYISAVLHKTTIEFLLSPVDFKNVSKQVI